MSYLDIARAVAEGHAGAAIHPYWAPGYPILISFFLWLFRPGPYWECPLVHVVNLLIFIGTLFAFQLFWREVLQWHQNLAKKSDATIPERAYWAIGYSTFGIATLNVITISLVGPDLLVAVFCCLAGWLVLHLRRLPGIRYALLLGLVLALGYYAKAPFFPIGIVFILCVFAKWPLSPRKIFLATIAFGTFLVLCAPFIAAISLSKGHFTFGESARLSQAFYINGVEYYEYWQGGPEGSGTPLHPAHKLSDYPTIFESSVRGIGTYPAWFDPSYWYEGITPHTNWKRQAAVFRSNLIWQGFSTIMELGAALVCVLTLLILLTDHRNSWASGFRKLWFIWLPGAVAFVMFASVHVEPRFLGGWLILLFAGAVCACSLPAFAGTRQVVGYIAAALLITTGAALVLQASREAVGIDHAAGRSARDASIAFFLLNNGLRPEDDVALIGNGFLAYWAHLARLHLVIEIPGGFASRPGHPATDFWESGQEQQKKVLAMIQRTGVKAIIADPQNSPVGSIPSTVPALWKKIDGTDAYVYLFPTSR